MLLGFFFVVFVFFFFAQPLKMADSKYYDQAVMSKNLMMLHLNFMTP